MRQGLTATRPAVSAYFLNLAARGKFAICSGGEVHSNPSSKELFMLAAAKPYVAPDAMEATINYFPKRGLTQGINPAGSAYSKEVAGPAPDARRVIMRNGRLDPSDFVLDCHGFCFVRHVAKVVDFFDSDEVRRVHYPEVEALVRAKTGASRVFVFEHKLRTTDVGLREAGKVHGIVRNVHNDYTESSGPECLRFHLPQETDALLQHRFAIVQVWRPGRGFPVRRLRRTQHVDGGFGDVRAQLRRRIWSVLLDILQPRPPLVLVSAHALRRSACF